MRESTNGRGDRTRSGTVVAEFRDRASLNRAVRELAGHSIPVDSIHVYVRAADGRRREIPVEEGAGTLRGALIGAGIGATIGVIIVVAVVSGAFGEAGVGFFGFQGVAGALRTILLTAAAAVPLGALVGMGRWKSDSVEDHELERGGAQVVVTSEELEPRAREILKRSGAVHISGR